MKKSSLLFLFFLISIFLVFILNITLVSACQGGEWTIVGGRIFDSDGKSVRNADVTVICHHKGTDNILTTQSFSSGFYKVCYELDKCNAGDVVSVSAEKDGVGSGRSSGIVKDFIDTRRVDIDIAIIKVIVPEFSLVVGMVTVLLSIVLFFVIRRK